MGKVRIVSPYRAGRGRSYVAPHLSALDVSAWVFDGVLALIGHHHDPKKLVVRDSPEAAYRRLARVIDPALIYWLEVADMRGRDCGDNRDGEDWLELFRLRCEELGLWRKCDSYAAWREEIVEALTDEPDAVSYVCDEGIYAYERGEIHSPAEALARTYAHRRKHSRVILTCGPSGSGKSHWMHGRDGGVVICLDGLREEELCRKRDDQSKNGQVMQLAKERFRECLRAKRDVVWDATNLREDGRAMIVQLARDYHAHTTVAVMATPPEELARRNRKRSHAIPQAVLARQLDRFQWPNAWEVHQVEPIV